MQLAFAIEETLSRWYPRSPSGRHSGSRSKSRTSRLSQLRPQNRMLSSALLRCCKKFGSLSFPPRFAFFIAAHWYYRVALQLVAKPQSFFVPFRLDQMGNEFLLVA